MKAIITLILVLTTNSIFAAEAKGLTQFTCGGMGPGTAFHVTFGGPRFADTVFMKYLGDELRPLLLQSESTLKVSDEHLSLNFTVGACGKVENSDTLVQCSMGPKDWVMANFGFTKAQQLAPDFFESAQITRGIQIKAFDLKVVKVSTDAVLKLEMTVDTADKKNLQVSIDRKLATLNQDWYMCKMQ